MKNTNYYMLWLFMLSNWSLDKIHPRWILICDPKKISWKVKVKTIILVYNYIIQANCWWHHLRTMSNGWMSYGVSVHGTMWTNSKFLWPCKKVKEVKVRTLDLVHNYIILANCWNHDRRSMLNGWIHKVAPSHCFWLTKARTVSILNWDPEGRSGPEIVN